MVADKTDAHEAERVLLLDPASVDLDADNRQATPESVQGLVASMRDLGQKVPGGAARVLATGRWRCVWGGRRLLAARILGVPYRALEVPGGLKEEEIVALRLTENACREQMTPLEVADDVARYMALSGCSQADAASRLHLSPAAVSKALAVRTLPADLHEFVRSFKVPPSVAYLVATVGDPQLQRELMREAAERRLKRDAVQARVDALRGRREPRPKALRLKLGGVEIAARTPTLESLQGFAEALAQGLRKLAKDGLPVSCLADLLKGR